VIGLGAKGLRRVLLLGAHSDDIEIGCGGTVLSLVARNPGLECYWAVFSGDRTRKQEARASAREFLSGAKVKRIRNESFKLSYFPSQWPRIKDVFEDIRREFEPELVLTHCRQDRHQDHAVLADLAWNTFRDHLILEYEIPKWDGDLGRPNLYVPIGRPAMARKVEALMRHFGTQRSKHWFDEETFRGLARLRGMECRVPDGYAEAFVARKVTIG
jgi:LmbE family N-acetylglucosaminyl deacetylase